jgi:hypothetical protein
MAGGEDDTVIVTPDGKVLPPSAGAPRPGMTGPSPAEYVIVPPGVGNAPDRGWGDYAGKAGQLAVNSAGMGAPYRAAAVLDQLYHGAPSYEEALKTYTGREEEFRKEFPKAAIASDIGGGVAGAVATSGYGIPAALGRVVPWLRGATIAPRVAMGVSEGILQGGLQGAGTTYSGIPSDYAKNAGMGMLFGAGAGAAAPVAGTALSAGGRALVEHGWMPGAFPGRLVSAAQADAQGLRNVANTPGAMLPDAGPTMQGTAQGARTGVGGPGKTALDTALADRDAGTARRIVGDINQTFGPTQPPRTVAEGIGERMGRLGPYYEDAYHRSQPVNTRRIADWFEDQIRNTTGEARGQMQRLRGDLDLQGHPGMLDDHAAKLGAVRSDIKGLLRQDDMKPGTLQPNTRRLLEDADRRMTEELQATVPGIRRLDALYAELGSQERAMLPGSPGRRIFKTDENAIWPDELRQIMTDAAQPKGILRAQSGEAARLRDAARSELEKIVGTSRNDLAKLESVLGQPQDWNAEKLAVMFGQDRAQRLFDVLQRERQWRNTYQNVVLGPQTADRLAAAKALDAGGGKIPDNLTAWATTLKTGQAIWDRMWETSNQRTRDRIAQLMATRDPVTIQQLVNDLLSATPRRNAAQTAAREGITRAIIGGGAAYSQ